ncbi:MAG: PAS domain-containing protein [bacterium]|nr:PAS domain-containing protein [bacterium]
MSDRSAGGPLPRPLMELLFESTSDGVYAVDAHKRLIAFNPAAERTLGYAGEDVIGRPCRQVIRSNLCAENCTMDRVLATGQPVTNTPASLVDAAGERVPVTLSCAVLRDDVDGLLGCVGTIRDLTRVKDLLQEVEHRRPFAGILSNDPCMTHILDVLPTIADSESTVLVQGETGTGKSLLARAIHNLSPRRERPFITINCGALPETLLESELFGYRAGAFTGASRDRAGRIAAAEGGTVFMDEIGDMSPGMQVKLLRFLQDRVYERLGDTRPREADVRVVAATNRGLEQLVQEGGFRRDLYYRINVLDVELPPLRERRGDIPLLAQRFLERLCLNRGKHLTGFTPAALDLLEDHDYPGNIRELENVVEHGFVLSPGPLIAAEHLPEVCRGGGGTGAPRSFADLEGKFIRDALEQHGWNRQETARALGIHKTTLLRRIRRLGLKLPRQDGRSRSRT